MNPNPNANPRHHYHHNHHHTHHGSSGTSSAQGYPGNNPMPNQLDDRGSCSGGLNIPNHPHSPMPPSSWVKNSPQPTTSNLPLTSITSSNAASGSCCSSPNVNNLLAAPGGMPASSYGASNSNSFQQQQQQQQNPHQFYAESPDVRYTPGTGNAKLSSTSNRPNQNLNMVNTGMQFYSNENHSDSSCYFQQQQQQHPTNFDCDHQNSMGKNNPVVCDNNGSSGDLQNPNNSNFYGFYPSHNTYHNSNHSHQQQQQQQQQQSQEYHHSNLNSGSNVPSPNDGDYSRFHGFNMSGSTNSAHSSHQQQQQLQSHPNQIQNTPLSCQQSQGYFGMIGNRHALHPQSHSPYAHCQQNPHQNAPFRRNSIESFSTEPGDLPFNVKYGCNFNTMGNIPFGDVIKRETGNGNMHASTWQTPREPSLNSLSHQHGNGNSQGYFFNNSNTNSNLNQRAPEHNFQNPHQQQQQQQPQPPQQQHFQNFKSCSFDMGHHSSMEIDQLKPDLQKSNNMSLTGTPSPVKHRSLSCSMMNSPFQFSSNSSSNDDGHFNFLDSIGNHSSCGNISNNPTSNSSSMSTSRNVNVPVDSLPVNQKAPTMDSSQQNECNQTGSGGVMVGGRTCPTSASNVDCDLKPVQDTKPLENIKSVPESLSSEPQEIPQMCESTDDGPPHVIKQEDSSGDINDDQGATPDFQNELASNMNEVVGKDIDSLITTTAGDRTSMDVSHTDEIDTKSSPSAPSIDEDGCHNLLLEALGDADVSNSSCSLGLLVNTGNEDNSNTSLSHLAITGANDSDDNDNESCHSGMSSLGCASKALSDICSSEVDRNRIQNVVGMTKISHSPQKISKRSFSEADKDLVINTTAVSFRNTILIPAGWKREIISSTGVKLENNLIVFYVSPSGTKLRTWDELKNYICSDGTCKCGLSCPLRLEQSFSFDPKVTNSCQAEESSVEENVNETAGTETSPKLLCNHKRKIPKSEDSPLISSTRDDLGDCGDLGGSTKKKRRISDGGSNNNAATTKVFVPQTSPSINAGNNVSVPFSQQSPDTTTQTPQTDMSPASSVSSEQSVFGGNRSTNSTPTPVPVSNPGTTGKSMATPKGPGKGKDNSNFGFPWPQVPVSHSPTPTSASVLATSPNTSTMTFWPSPNQANMAVNCVPIITTSANNNSMAATSPSTTMTLKKSGCQHHLTKGLSLSNKKRASSPCPNIDVRQIPLEQNRPPPRQILHIPTSLTSHTITHDNPSVSLFPITSTTPVENPLLNMNTGFSISPVISTSTNNSGGSSLQPNLFTNTLQFAPQHQPLQGTTTLVNSNLNIFPLPLQFQRVPSPVVSSGTPSSIATTPANTLIHQSLPSSITISMVGGSPGSSQVQLPSSSSQIITSNASSCNNGQPSLPTSSSSNTRDCTVSEKSPLQLVQDVVDRFQSSKGGADNKDDAVSLDVVVSTSSSSPKAFGTSSEPPKVGPSKDESDNKASESEKSVKLEAVPPARMDKNEARTKKSGTDASTRPHPENDNPQACTISVAPAVSNPSSVSEPDRPQITVVNLPLPVSSTVTTSTAIPISAAVSAAHSMNLTQPLVATSSIINCATSTGVISVNPTSMANHQPIILQQHPSHTDIQTSSFITTTAGHGNSVGGTQSIRYPLFQTIQPFFLNSAGTPGGQLIISPQPTATAHPGDQQPFIYEQQTQAGSDHQMQNMLQQTTMVLDPSVCGNPPGSKKKKKRLSKKQQQQQAQLHLQQQLLLQQLAHQQAQVQQQVAQAQQHQTIPLTIFPQSFNLGAQGFSLQPMNMNMNMNFFPTPTILTLPNLILNPADGTLFLQPSTPLQTATQQHPQTTVKLGQFPIAAAPNTVVSTGQTIQTGQQTQSINVIAPKKDGNFGSNITLTALPSDQMTLIKTGPASADIMSDDSRQNPTPDSSTNDCQLGLNLNPTNSITISLPPMPNSNAINISSLNQGNNKKMNVKTRVVSSSSGSGAPKRIFTQKQILPKIDSTTPSMENS